MKTYFHFHFHELKFHFVLTLSSLFLCLLICYVYNIELFYLCFQPLSNLRESNYFIFTNLTEFFYIKLKLIFDFSLFIISNILIFQVFSFIMSGLHKNENFAIVKLLYKYSIILVCWNYFTFVYVLPYVTSFFIENSKNLVYLEIYFEPKIDLYVSLITTFFIYTNMALFYIFLLFFLTKNMDVVKVIRYRKFFYFKFIFLATVLSPPDIASQMIISFLLIFFFEGTVLQKFFKK